MNISRALRTALPFGVTAVGAAVAVGSVPAESVDVGAGRWAASLTEDQAKSLLEPRRLMALPAAYRRALSRSQASPEFQASFWRSVVSGFRSTHALSDDQSAVLVKAETALTPSLFDGS